MKITKIEIRNFRAFYGTYQIDLHKAGKNLLIYGENGSGKTSLHKALELFLSSSESNSIKFIDHKNFFVTDEGYVRLHFTPDPDLQKETYEWSESEAALDDTKVQPMIDASRAKGFLDYKALLHTHYLHYEKDTVDVFNLLINTLLKNVINDLADPPNSFAEEWLEISGLLFPEQESVREIEVSRQQLETFNAGVENILTRLETDTNEMLRKFGYENTVITVDFNYQETQFNRDSNEWDPPQILLKVDFFGSDQPKHHQFLNEAKLSAIALSIFFAGFKLQPPSDLRILALDDVLIGLDMSNRLPVLDILDEYFSDYQIFLTTYDKAWYEIVKQRTSRGGKWKTVEFYFSQTDEYELPIYAEDKAYLEKAREYLDATDYKACAIYVRTAFEAAIKRYCERKDLAIKYRENPKDLRSEDFWVPIKMETGDADIPILDLRIVDKIERARKFILNELSHATFANIYRKELEDAIAAVVDLEAALAQV